MTRSILVEVGVTLSWLHARPALVKKILRAIMGFRRQSVTAGNGVLPSNIAKFSSHLFCDRDVLCIPFVIMTIVL
jgi:hypothetical protein